MEGKFEYCIIFIMLHWDSDIERRREEIRYLIGIDTWRGSLNIASYI